MADVQNVEIVYQSDDCYAPYLGVSLYSLLQNNIDADFEIVVIDDGICANNKNKLKTLVEGSGKDIRFISSDDAQLNQIKEIFKNYTGFRANRNSYLKLGYPTISHADRILYLDCDTLICDGISELLGANMHNNIAAMALDSSVDHVYKRFIGLRDNDYYFNSGVILIDRRRWVTKQIYESILKLKQSGVSFNTVDQDYLNIALAGSVEKLSNRFNFQPFHRRYSAQQYFRVYQTGDSYYTAEELGSASDKPVILHYFRYLGMHPWDKGSLHPFSDDYKSWQLRSPWRGYCPKKPKLSTPIRVERILYRILPKTTFLRVFKLMHDKLLSS